MEIFVSCAILLIFPWLLGLCFVIGPAKGAWTTVEMNNSIIVEKQFDIVQTNFKIKVPASQSFLESLRKYHAEIAFKEDLDESEYVQNILECRLQSEKPLQLDFFDRLD